MPLYIDNKFDGYIAGLINVQEFLAKILSSEITSRWIIDIQTNGQSFFHEVGDDSESVPSLGATKELRIGSQVWTIAVVPTRKFVATRSNNLPEMLLAGGLILSILLGACVYLAYRFFSNGRVLASSNEQLRQSEETFRTAMSHASIGMALLSLEGKWLKVNMALCDMLGYSHDEFLTTDLQSITHPDDVNADLDYVQKLLNNEISSYQIEKRYFHKNDDIVWALLSVSLVRDASGAPKYFISQIQNMTESKKLGKVLENQAALLDLAHDAILVRNLNDEIVFWNKGAEYTYGWSKDEVIGRVTHNFLKTEFPQPLEDIKEQLARNGEWNGELIHTKKNGDTIAIASRWAIQTDKLGNPIGTLEINRGHYRTRAVDAAAGQFQYRAGTLCLCCFP